MSPTHPYASLRTSLRVCIYTRYWKRPIGIFRVKLKAIIILLGSFIDARKMMALHAFILSFIILNVLTTNPRRQNVKKKNK